MNPHDSNRPIFLNNDPTMAEMMFARLFLYIIFGAICFAIGYWSGERRGFYEGKQVPKLCPAPQSYPKTKAQMKEFIKSRQSQAEGWIK